MRFSDFSRYFIISAKSGISYFRFWIPVCAGIFLTLTLTALTVVQAGSKTPWDTSFKPGDKVCIYDISEADPLVDSYNDSLKYWDNSQTGDKKARRVLRASVRRLQLRILQPGLVVSGTPDKRGRYWHSGSLVVVSGGYRPTAEKTYTIQRGKNALLGQIGRSWVTNWSVIHFEKARFKKKPIVGNCVRKYDHY